MQFNTIEPFYAILKCLSYISKKEVCVPCTIKKYIDKTEAFGGSCNVHTFKMLGLTPLANSFLHLKNACYM